MILCKHYDDCSKFIDDVVDDLLPYDKIFASNEYVYYHIKYSADMTVYDYILLKYFEAKSYYDLIGTDKINRFHNIVIGYIDSNFEYIKGKIRKDGTLYDPGKITPQSMVNGYNITQVPSDTKEKYHSSLWEKYKSLEEFADEQA